jgi:hypothetical protein
VSVEGGPATPQQRLAQSRRALVAQLQGRRPVVPEDDVFPAVAVPAGEPGSYDRFGWSSLARGMVRRWWRRHPANAVGQLARPVLERYAREEPAKLVGAAAAAGALVVLVRPWRLLSITAVLAAVLKTSDVADMVTTLMQNNATPRKDPP